MEFEDENKCRLYLCKQYFGGDYVCKKFKDAHEYRNWIHDKENQENVINTSYEPICTPLYMKAFDKAILHMRSKGFLFGDN